MNESTVTCETKANNTWIHCRKKCHPSAAQMTLLHSLLSKRKYIIFKRSRRRFRFSLISIVKGRCCNSSINQRPTLILMGVVSTDTTCYRCWSVCFPAEGHSVLFFLSVTSGHRETVHLITTHPEGARNMQGDWPQSLEQAHPLLLKQTFT